MRNFDFKFKKIKEGRYHFDIVTPYVRYKYMTDVWYNRMVEIGLWWWRLEIHYQGGKVGRSFAELFHIIDRLVRFVYYLIINKIKHYFKKIFKSNKEEKMNILGKLKRNTQTPKCLMSVYELVPVIVYKTTEFGMRMVDLDKSTGREEKLIKSFILPLKNFEVGKVFNYKERSIEFDNYVRDVKFSVTVTDEVNEFFTSGNLAPELIIFKNAKLQETDFNFIIKSDSDGYETYTWYQGKQIVVKLRIEKI